MSRLPITKTPKVLVGGAFIRSESGRVFPLRAKDGSFVGHIPQCTRKDLRNAVEAAAKAGPGWSKRTAYNRGQILYRLAEMIEARSEEMARALSVHGLSASAARREVEASVDRLVHYAGWTDKVEQVLGGVNSVAGPFFNFTVCDPMGVVGVLCPDAPALLGLVSLVAPVIATGNTAVVITSEAAPFPGVVLGEMLATSDLPGGVVNLLTGFRKEMVPTLATHEHIRAVTGVASAADRRTLREGASASIKRVHLHAAEEKLDWFSPTMQGPEALAATVEFKTTWHPIGS
jgi:acyl-CoA reductase-like NAD-dependent aldehyde dehydrogenase